MDHIRKFLQLDNIIPIAKTLPDELVTIISDFISPTIIKLKNLNDTLPNYLKFLIHWNRYDLNERGGSVLPVDIYNNLENYNIFDIVRLEQIKDIDNIIQVAPLFYKLCNKGNTTVNAKHELERWTGNEPFSSCFRFRSWLYKRHVSSPNFKLVNEPSNYIDRSSVALAFFILKYPYKTSNNYNWGHITFKIKHAPLITKKKLNNYFIKHNLPLLETYFHRFAAGYPY